MKCPECIDAGKISVCEVTISNQDIKDQLEDIELSQYKQVTLYEFLVLDYLKTINKTVSTNTISNALDKSAATVTSTINKLTQRGFVKLDLEASRKLKKDFYFITQKCDKYVTTILKMIQKAIEEKEAEA